jgi:hypothetical protein
MANIGRHELFEWHFCSYFVLINDRLQVKEVSLRLYLLGHRRALPFVCLLYHSFIAVQFCLLDSFDLGSFPQNFRLLAFLVLVGSRKSDFMVGPVVERRNSEVPLPPVIRMPAFV